MKYLKLKSRNLLQARAAILLSIIALDILCGETAYSFSLFFLLIKSRLHIGFLSSGELLFISEINCIQKAGKALKQSAMLQKQCVK